VYLGGREKGKKHEKMGRGTEERRLIFRWHGMAWHGIGKNDFSFFFLLGCGYRYKLCVHKLISSSFGVSVFIAGV